MYYCDFVLCFEKIKHTVSTSDYLSECFPAADTSLIQNSDFQSLSRRPLVGWGSRAGGPRGQFLISYKNLVTNDH